MSRRQAMDGDGSLEAIEVRGMTREAFLARAALAAGTVYGAGAVGPVVREALAVDPQRLEAVGDLNILNFALTLQYIELTFYEQVAVGVGDGLFDEITANEAEHVRVLERLIRQLTGTPVSPPDVFFGRSLGGRDSALRTARVLEETTAAALVIAIPEMTSREAMIRLGALEQVDARHAALVSDAGGEDPAPKAFENELSIPEARTRLAPYVPEFE
jgi:hypothetical protein